MPFLRDTQGRITLITDPKGNKYQYSYDTNGNLATVTYSALPQQNPPQYAYSYDTTHRLTGGTDPDGNLLPTTQYDASGRLQSVSETVQDYLGKPTTYRTTYSYNTATNTTTITYPADANGNVGTATMVYDGYGMLLSATDPLGHVTTNLYDVSHNLTSTTDPLLHITSFTYDSNGNRTSVTYQKTPTSTNTTSKTFYNQFSEPTQFIDQLNNVRNVQYDGNFFPTLITDTIDSSTAVLESFHYNSDGTKQADAPGYDLTLLPNKATQYTYDANGNLASATDPLGRLTQYHYDSLGRLLSMTPPLPAGVTDATLVTTNYQYDPLGHMTEIDAPQNRVTKYEYDNNSNKVSETDGRGNKTIFQYDALNRLILTTYPTTPATSVSRTYDFRGNLIDLTDQSGHVTRNIYDLAGRLTSVTTGFGTTDAGTVGYTYYDDDRKKTETDARGNITTYTYDAAGRVTNVAAVVNSQTSATTYAYDDANNVVSTTDPNQHTTRNAYDSRKRLRTITYNDNTFDANSYDTANNLTSATDQAGATVQYTYDDANQLKSVVQLNHPDTAHNTFSYGYDSNGNLTAGTDANGHTSQNGFDFLNELNNEVLPAGGPTQTRTYDADGNLSTLKDFNGKTTTYGYDVLNRLTSIAPDSTLGDPTVTFTYTGTGQIATMTDASGTTTYGYDNADRLNTKGTPEGMLTYAYDPAGNLASLSSSNSNGASVSYGYDGLNRLSTVVDNRLPAGQNTTAYQYDLASNLVTATYPSGLQSTFHYDTLNRLDSTSSQRFSYTYQLGPTGIWHSAAEGTGRTLTWSYDAIYRLRNEAIANDPNSNNGTVGYGLDPVANRLTQSATLSGISSGTFAFDANDRLATETYDNNGNVLTSGGKSFKYDFQNRLKSVNNGAITLVYDGEGNRVAKTVGGITTQYLVDDLNPTGLPQVVDELLNSTVQRTYTYGLNRISENQLVSGTWNASFYGYDGGGHVRLLTDTTGTVTDTYDYDAFGNLLNSTGSTPSNYLYRGEQFDPDLALYYLRARYYNPVSGRFLSRDPKSGHPSDPGTLHNYLYARHNPVNWGDPTGRLATVQYLSLTENIVLSAAVISALDQLAEEINCLYTFDASAVQQIPKYSGFGRFSIQRVGRCWAKVLASQQVSFAGPAPTASGEPTTPDPRAPKNPNPDDPCYKKYLEDAAACGENYTDDHEYNACMEVAWLNYIRCLDNLPRTPFPPFKPYKSPR